MIRVFIRVSSELFCCCMLWPPDAILFGNDLVHSRARAGRLKVMARSCHVGLQRVVFRSRGKWCRGAKEKERQRARSFSPKCYEFIHFVLPADRVVFANYHTLYATDHLWRDQGVTAVVVVVRMHTLRGTQRERGSQKSSLGPGSFISGESRLIDKGTLGPGTSTFYSVRARPC